MTIKSILDTDLYKLTMMQAVMFLFPHEKVRYKFFNRGKHKFTKKMIFRIQHAVKSMKDIKDDPFMFDRLREKCPFLSPMFIDFLRCYKFDPNEISFEVITKGDDVIHFGITIEGYWYRTILWEVPLMAIISEVYMSEMYPNLIYELDVLGRTKEISNYLSRNDIWFAELGTRRRFSLSTHNIVLEALSMCRTFTGTSNVMFGLQRNLKLMGSIAHEWFMFHGAKYGYKQANIQALKHWSSMYSDSLGVALPDTYTSNVFLRSFTAKYAKLFDGVRHDSGDPIEFAEKIINHYNNLGIDPATKTIIFSDGLTKEKTIEIADFCYDKIKYSFGIGTYLTNGFDSADVIPMNIVIKMTECLPHGEKEWLPCVKLSDIEGKNTGEESEIILCKQSLKI